MLFRGQKSNYLLTAVLIASSILFIGYVNGKLNLSGGSYQLYYQQIKHQILRWQYRNDSKKTGALNYLLHQGNYHYGLIMDENHEKIFQSMARAKHVIPDDTEERKELITMSWDSIKNRYGVPSNQNLTTVKDQLKNELLREHIDYAFEAWKLPWSKHLGFEDFCEYVLPYRYDNEPLEPWRRMFFRGYQWVMDSIKDPSDPIEVATVINNELGTWFKFHELFYQWPVALSASQLIQGQMGVCRDEHGIAAYAMRAMGLAIAHERIPKWALGSMGHDFSSVMDKNGNFVGFLGAEHPPGENIFESIVPKVFREMFSLQYNPLLEAGLDPLDIPPVLRNPHIVDVTNNYTHTTDVRVNLTQPPPGNTQFAYLCVFNALRWQPIFWGKIEGDSAIFRDMGRGATYLPIYYKNGRLIPAAWPVHINLDGSIRTMEIIHENENVRLYRKYPISDRLIRLANHMIGGKFQGANTPDFKDAVTLFEIIEPPVHHIQKKKINSLHRFRYVRYLLPPLKPDCFGNVAETTYYARQHDNEMPLRGEIISSKDVSLQQGSILFDGKLDNYVSAFYKSIPELRPDPASHKIISESDTVWIGLDLGEPKFISEIDYCPRNATNGVYPGYRYELFYWDGRWISLGQRKSTSDYLDYDEVPKGALLWLRNLDSGKEEHVFTYENGKQLF